MAVRCHLIRSMANHPKSLLEELLCRLHVPLLAQHAINEIAIFIDCPIQITPLPVDFQVGFIDIPGFPSLATSLDSSLLRSEWGKPRLRVSDGFMRKRKTTR